MWQYLTDKNTANGENSAKLPITALTLFEYSLIIDVTVAKPSKGGDAKL